MGLLGLANVGKSSTFNLLTSQAVAASNFPFCTIEPTESRVAVPDERYDYLCDLWNPPSKYPAYLWVTDIAGLVKGAAEGEGLGNAFLSNLLAVDGNYHVVRAFDDNEVVHVELDVNPVRDLEIIQSELCKKDLVFLKKAIETETKDCRKAGGSYKLSEHFVNTMDKVKELLESNQPVFNADWSTSEIDLINEKLVLLTTKPVTYLVNLSKKDYIRKKNKYLLGIHNWVKEHGGGTIIPYSVEYEEELVAAKEDPEEVKRIIAENSDTPSALQKIIKTGYHALNLTHFFTAGEKEVRCWTMQSGSTAPAAAGIIHTDFERGFIKAEVVAFDDFKELCNNQPSMNGVKAAGKYRQEGKTYIMKDADIVHFMFNVTAPAKKK